MFISLLTIGWELCVCVCVWTVSLLTYRSTVSSLLYPSSSLTPIRPPTLPLSLSQWDPGHLFPLARNLSGHTLRVLDSSQAEQPWESAGWLIYRYTWRRSCGEVSRGLVPCFTLPRTGPVLWVSGDLEKWCSGSKGGQCHRTWGDAEIWEMYCNWAISLFAAPSSQADRGGRRGGSGRGEASGSVTGRFLCDKVDILQDIEQFLCYKRFKIFRY